MGSEILIGLIFGFLAYIFAFEQSEREDKNEKEAREESLRHKREKVPSLEFRPLLLKSYSPKAPSLNLQKFTHSRIGVFYLSLPTQEIEKTTQWLEKISDSLEKLSIQLRICQGPHNGNEFFWFIGLHGDRNRIGDRTLQWTAHFHNFFLQYHNEGNHSGGWKALFFEGDLTTLEDEGHIYFFNGPIIESLRNLAERGSPQGIYLDKGAKTTLGQLYKFSESPDGLFKFEGLYPRDYYMSQLKTGKRDYLLKFFYLYCWVDLEVPQALEEGINHEDFQIRLAVLEVIKTLQMDSLKNKLVALLQREKEPLVKSSLLKTLAILGGEELLASFIACTHDSHPFIVINALLALHRNFPQKVSGTIESLIKSKKPILQFVGKLFNRDLSKKNQIPIELERVPEGDLDFFIGQISKGPDFKELEKKVELIFPFLSGKQKLILFSEGFLLQYQQSHR